MRLAAVVAVAIAALAPRPAAALSSPTVAVMPFKDLSGQKGSIGEAIRETVTSDLKDVPGIKVIERGNIDKILAEQNLQAQKADLDPLSTVKVGKLLGASLIVAGAYQKAATSVRLTARFVRVETGEIVGTAKVDGASSDFLRLQDRVTSELLKSAGIEQKQVQRFASRVRPKLKSLKSVELYGDAVVEVDDQKRRDLLKQALDVDPGFSYALRDLEELEKRLVQYDAVRKAEQSKELKTLLEQTKTEKDPIKLNTAWMMLMGKLQTDRRWVAVAKLSRQLMANPPPPMPNVPYSMAEQAHYNLITALNILKDRDAVLREGEKFLAKYPGSMSYQGVRATMDQVIEYKRNVEEGKGEVVKELSSLSPEDRADECKLGAVYQSHHQMREARSHLEACRANRPKRWPETFPVQLLIPVTIDQGDFGATRRYLAELGRIDPKGARSFSGFEWQIPADY